MSDFLLENQLARKVIGGLGLPLPLPTRLERSTGPWAEKPLAGKTAIVSGDAGSPLVAAAREALGAAGANLPEPTATSPQTGQRVDLLVYDGSAASDPAGLRGAYDFLHPWVGQVAPSGRVIVLARPPEAETSPARAAAQRGLEGFARALGKEVGRVGATTQTVYVAAGAESRLEAVLRWLASPRSAFVSLQPLRVDAAASGPDGKVWVRPLADKVVLLTGAARGIGAATATLLAAEGAKVVCVDRPGDEQPLKEAATRIGGWVLTVDVTDPAAPQRIVDELRARHGGLDVVIHNAGITRDKTLARMTPELWDQAVDVNLGAVVRITDALLGSGLVRDGGRIVCLSSVAGIAGNVGQTNYAASKAGLIGFVEALARSGIGARGITANAVAPGFIETRLTAAIPVAIREVGRRLAALAQGGQPEDVGQLLTFLATPGSIGLQGRVIRVCGGAFIGA